MKIHLGSDHAGFELKDSFKKYLIKNNYKVVDHGTNNGIDSVSYAKYGKMLGEAVVKTGEIGIGICGTGLGISYALNRVKGIRAARVTSIEDAHLAKKHNNANVLAFGGRQVKPEEAFKMFEEWHKTKYESGRHQSRIDELDL